jgi:amino acid adenylation domain-containing protein
MEPDFPQDRKDFVLEDTAARIVVSTEQSSSTVSAGSDVVVLEIDDPFSPIKAQPVTNPVTALKPHHLAYVIYTSGSTGKPKGVMIEHRNLLDYVFGLKQNTDIDQCRSYALVSSIATDPSLVFGAALHVFSKESVSNIEYLHDYFTTHSIDCLKIVPSHWKALSVPGALLLPKRLLVFGGEALSSEVIEQIRQADSVCRVVNHYGPTETTIWSTLKQVETVGNGVVEIGRPIANTQLFVLNPSLQPAPVGVAGELFIGGDGLARGYLNRAELTAERFVPHPYSSQAGERPYRTGDMVRWREPGELEFIGRVDGQVKIRGFRVELGEVEAALRQQEQVREAVVISSAAATGENRLVAYVLTEQETTLTTSGLRAGLKALLPGPSREPVMSSKLPPLVNQSEPPKKLLVTPKLWLTLSWVVPQLNVALSPKILISVWSNR